MTEMYPDPETLELRRLAAVLLELDPDKVANWGDMDDAFENKYGFGLGEVDELIIDLVYLTPPRPSLETGELVQFFGRECPGSVGVWEPVLLRNYEPAWDPVFLGQGEPADGESDES